MPLPLDQCCDRDTHTSRTGQQVNRPVVPWCTQGGTEPERQEQIWVGSVTLASMLQDGAHSANNRRTFCGDFDGDGNLDIALLDGSSDAVTLRVMYSPATRLVRAGRILGAVKTTLSVSVVFRQLLSSEHSTVHVGNFDQDMFEDFVMLGQTSHSIPTMVSHGDGAWSALVGEGSEFPAESNTGLHLMGTTAFDAQDP